LKIASIGRALLQVLIVFAAAEKVNPSVAKFSQVGGGLTRLIGSPDIFYVYCRLC
jgi:hypothetical protein